MKSIFRYLIGSLLFSQVAFASFEETSRRYLTNHELVLAMNSIVPINTCSTHSLDKEKTALGVDAPLTGTPISPTPNQSTVALITKCIGEGFAGISFRSYPIQRLIGQESFDILNNQSLSHWNRVPAEIQKKIIANMVFVILGSDETIKDFDIIEPDVLREKLFQATQPLGELSNIEIIKKISINLALRDEFLSY